MICEAINVNVVITVVYECRDFLPSLSIVPGPVVIRLLIGNIRLYYWSAPKPCYLI